VPRVRTFLLFVPLLIAAPAAAQDQSAPCQPITPVRVSVTTMDGPTIRGTLLCLTAREVVLASDGQMTTTALSAVRRIETPPDPQWDGAVKGAVLPLVMWALICRHCEADAMLRMTAAYATIGAVWDGLDRNQKRIYDRRPAAAIAWRVRF
jgi:hypothetical protein